jgi:hypothetical protein
MGGRGGDQSIVARRACRLDMADPGGFKVRGNTFRYGKKGRISN